MQQTDQNIIRFDIGVHDIALAQQTHRQEELMSVCPNSSDIEPDIFTKPLHYISEVHAMKEMNVAGNGTLNLNCHPP